MQTIVEAIAAVWLPERIAQWLEHEADSAISKAVSDGDEDGPGRPPVAGEVIGDLLDQYPAELTDDAWSAVFGLVPDQMFVNLDAEIRDIALDCREDRNSLAYNGVSQRDFL